MENYFECKNKNKCFECIFQTVNDDYNYICTLERIQMYMTRILDKVRET